ncbi:unnamed protein product, partial [marine sediment metagenome]
VLTLGMFFMRGCEMAAAGFGYLVSLMKKK